MTVKGDPCGLVWYLPNTAALCRSMKTETQTEKPLAMVYAPHFLLRVSAFWLRSCNTCDRTGGTFYKGFVWEAISFTFRHGNTDAMTGCNWPRSKVGCVFHSVEIQTWEHYHCVSCPGSGYRRCACSILTSWSNWIIDPWILNFLQNNSVWKRQRPCPMIMWWPLSAVVCAVWSESNMKGKKTNQQKHIKQTPFRWHQCQLWCIAL